MKRLLVPFVVAIMLAATSGSWAFWMDFEEGLGNDGGQIVGIPGVTFTDSAGLPWIYGDSLNGSYNTHSIDLGYGFGNYHHYGNVFAWLDTTGDWGRINFDDANGTWFQTGYCSYSPFTLTAYDASNAVLDTAVGPANLDNFGYLRVDAPNIAYVILSDTGDQWIVDQMSGDMEGGTDPRIPEPGILLLLGTGLVGLASYGRFSSRRRGKA